MKLKLIAATAVMLLAAGCSSKTAPPTAPTSAAPPAAPTSAAANLPSPAQICAGLDEEWQDNQTPMIGDPSTPDETKRNVTSKAEWEMNRLVSEGMKPAAAAKLVADAINSTCQQYSYAIAALW
ncbi:MAG: hypothetical protein ACRDTS_16625 [Mycobacterium sp.]